MAQTMWTGRFWKAAAERAVKTFSQTLLVLFGADQFNVLNVDWESALGIGLGALVLSLLSSLASAAVSGDGPSLTNDERLSRPVV